MEPTTGVLVRHNKGQHFVGDTGGAEHYFRIDTDYPWTAGYLALQYLEAVGGKTHWTSQLTTGEARTAAQAPGEGTYYVGDHVGGNLVQTVGAALDTAEFEGGAVVTIELQDKLGQRMADIERRITRASAGADSRYATPQIKERTKASSEDKTPPPYSLGQPIYPSRSPAWTVPSAFKVAFLEATLETPGESMSLVRLWRNNMMISEIELKAGEKRNIIKIVGDDGHFSTKDFIIVEVKIAGEKAANLAVFLRGANIQSNND